MRELVLAATVSFAVTALTSTAEARDQIVASGSVTAASYAEAVAAEFAKAGHPTPEYRSVDTGGDVGPLCGGVGSEFPDVAVTAQRVKDGEAAECRENGVERLAEIRFGMDALVVVAEGELVEHMGNLTSRHLWLATGAQVPVNGVLAANPYKLWSDIDPSLPANTIEILMPPDESGLEEVFDAMIEPICQSDPLVQVLGDAQKQEICGSHREDEAIVPVADSAEMPEILDEIDHAVAIMSHQAFVSADNDGDDDDAAFRIDGVAPMPETIVNGSYKGAYPLYLYVKAAHLGQVPGLKDFVAEFVSEKAIGENGYLVQVGLVPLSAEECRAAQAAAAALAATN